MLGALNAPPLLRRAHGKFHRIVGFLEWLSEHCQYPGVPTQVLSPPNRKRLP
jgi:hypothetical protein